MTSSIFSSEIHINELVHLLRRETKSIKKTATLFFSFAKNEILCIQEKKLYKHLQKNVRKSSATFEVIYLTKET